jgi:2-polyprenyl-6-methoxyphenol hydroxylase-like FAD-dependent oxidoreductase
VGNVVNRSLRPTDIPESTYQELGVEARQRWPDPWRLAMLECIERRSLIGTPIAEYVPDQLVNGRLALVGDAAHVPTPMTGNGFSASLSDAEALAECLAGGIRRGSAEQALIEYQAMRLSSARSLVQSGQQFSRSFASRNR